MRSRLLQVKEPVLHRSDASTRRSIHIYLQACIQPFEMAILTGIALTAVGALLLSKALKESFWPRAHGSKAQIIEINDYEVLDDNQDLASHGYKVKINDSID